MAAMTRIMASMGLAVTLLLAGCSISERMNGTYEGFRDVPVQPGTDPIVAHQLGLVKVVAKESGAAGLSDGGMAVLGRLEPGSKSLTFVPLQIAGIPVERQPEEVVKKYTVELVPQKDGSWLYGGSVKLNQVQKTP